MAIAIVLPSGTGAAPPLVARFFAYGHICHVGGGDHAASSFLTLPKLGGIFPRNMVSRGEFFAGGDEVVDEGRFPLGKIVGRWIPMVPGFSCKHQHSVGGI